MSDVIGLGPEESTVATEYWHRLDDGRVQCDVCPRACKLQDGQRGLCFVRAAQGDEIVLTTYGRSSGFCIDPIEKKPLNHFLPGTPVLSFGTAGCNLTCKFCQNWDMSKSREFSKLASKASPAALAAAAEQTGCRSIAFTYNDPVIFMEYAIDTAIACHERSIKAVAVTAGYMCAEPRAAFYRHMDAANVDLKAFTEDFYWRLSSSHLASVLETLEYIHHETDCWLEITNLVIPGENDSDREFDEMTGWIREHLGPDVPLHFTAFHPDFKMQETPGTPAATLVRAYDIARRNGLNHVYTGNVHDEKHGSTYCTGCGGRLIGRDWHKITAWNLDATGHCRDCGTKLAGVFDGAPGDWGRRRQRVMIGNEGEPVRATRPVVRRKGAQRKAKGATSMAAADQTGGSVRPAGGVKPAEVAGQFYPADPAELRGHVEDALRNAFGSAVRPKAMIVPHAGYGYSAPIAAAGYRTIVPLRGRIRRVVLLGPPHRMPVEGIAVPGYDAFATPLGEVRVDRAAIGQILDLPFVNIQDEAFGREHCLEVQLPFLQRILGDVAIVPMLVGRTQPEQVAQVIDALWGGPETLILVSSDLSHYHDDAAARKLDGHATTAIETLRPDMLEKPHACGRHAIRGLLVSARNRFMRATALDVRNSSETIGTPDRVVGYGTYLFEEADKAQLPAPQGSFLLQLAQQVIALGVENGSQPTIQVNNVPPPLRSTRATFVTVTLDGKLRGCIGSVQPHRALVEDVAINAYKAAFEDRRFKPLTGAELPQIGVSVSVLSCQAPIAADSEESLLAQLRPHVDGLVIRDEALKKGALFLPHVWEGITDPKIFLNRLREKAGLPADHWSPDFKAWRFIAEHIEPEKRAA
jgi:pyruvate formate lyase activating enzyme